MHGLARFTHGFDDVGIRTAAAKIATHAFADLLIAVRVTFLDQADGADDLSARAKAALERVVLDERALDGMKRPLAGQTLDRRNFVSTLHDGKRKARERAPSVDEHGARAALSMIATFFRPDEPETFAQRIEQRRTRLDVEVVFFAVDT